ncbi:MAG: hypothetical protein E7222_10475 [Clostridiales bacterium]|nr:hypothetical protein [Clostridiales bacterium]
MEAKEFLSFNKNNETEYFTKGAEIYDAVKSGKYTTPTQQEFSKLSEYEQATVIESIFANLHRVATREAWYIINMYKIHPKKAEDLISIIDEKMVEIFNLFNKSASTNYSISTFICIYKFEYIRSLMGEEHNMSEAQIKNFNAVHKAMAEILSENGIDTDSITARMVKERLDEKCPSHPLSEALVQSLMDWLEGALSIEEMFNVNDVRLNDPALTAKATEDEACISNLDVHTRVYFSRIFHRMNDKDWLVFLKDNGMLGDDIQEMEADEFIGTELYVTVFGKKTGKDAKKKMVKTVYNRSLKVDEIMKSIPYEVKLEYVNELKEYFEEQVERIFTEYFE